MTADAWMMVLVSVAVVTILGRLVAATVRSIRSEHSPSRSMRRDCRWATVIGVLFVVSWLGVLVAESRSFTDDRRSHGGAVRAGDFAAHFLQSALENWRFEFLQVISFVVLAALYVHEVSAASKDSAEKTEASLRDIDASAGASPSMAPSAPGRAWKLPNSRLEPTNMLGRP